MQRHAKAVNSSPMGQVNGCGGGASFTGNAHLGIEGIKSLV